MIWLLEDFDLLSVLLRAFVLCFESLLLGGILFLLFAVDNTSAELKPALRRWSAAAALSLAVAEICSVAASAAVLAGGAGFSPRSALLTTPALTGIAIAAVSLVAAAGLRGTSRYLPLLPCALVLAGSVGLSHAASRLDHRMLLVWMTAAHHLGTAAWLGAMPFLLLALRSRLDSAAKLRVARRYSRLALAGSATLIFAGVVMAWFYLGGWAGLYGTAYGVLLSAKVYLLLLLLLLGAGNYLLLRRLAGARGGLIARLRAVSEAEIGIAGTILLTAASLTAQPPAVDVAAQNRLSLHQVVERLRWQAPRISSPPLGALEPPTSMRQALSERQFAGASVSDANDRAWSEYNHHWAGLIVLACGLLALLARMPSQRWARHWPLLFVALAAFIVLRADPETWPLGPRGFWQSFAEPDALEHRLYAVLIVLFAWFEWSVETGRLRAPRWAYVFPLLCAAGGALLVTHSHSLTDAREETLTGLVHTPVAMLGATIGWARWLELRLPEDTRLSRVSRWLWPVCLALTGLLLLDYRES